MYDSFNNLPQHERPMAEPLDLSDDDLDSLVNVHVNRTCKEIVTRHSIPVQRDLFMNILPNQQTYYEERHVEVSYTPTHHELNKDNLHTYIYPTNYEVRQYQYDIVRSALFENILCAIPTGTGKTFIASTVMLNYYRWTKKAKIIFTAPTRPLVAQQIKACLGITGIPYSDTAILLDKSRKNREEIWQQKRVFFTTPQVVENDLKRGVLDPKDVVLLVIDEAHRARGNYAYVELTKFIDRFNTSYRLLALTATPAADLEGVQEVVNNLHISKVEIRTEDSMDIVRYMKRRDREMVEIGLLTEIEDVIEQLGIAISPTLQEAVQQGIYEACEPHQINAFVAMQQSQKIILNPSIPEGLKWKNYFLLQLLGQVGHMLRRLRIYGLRSFYSYFQNKYLEFTTKYSMKKSTNKTAANFYYNPILGTTLKKCAELLDNSKYMGHEKLQYLTEELSNFFTHAQPDSRAIIFTELRESALEIVKSIDLMNEQALRPHIFIGQAKGKEGFDEESFVRKNKPKGRTKADRQNRIDAEKRAEEEKQKKKEQQKLERSSRRTGSSEEAQISGMNQKQQKKVISDFKKGIHNILVCTSIGEEGLDIGEVDLIICYDSTSSPIKNIQRMGRTGRKRDGKIVLLFSGNEKFKFEQAMNDYESLQATISHNNIEYTNSDRILPSEVVPQCQEEFIVISNENEEVNRMDDTDEVIKFATQAMLGKLKTNKQTKKETQSKGQKKSQAKKFMMPDKVQEGFVNAKNLVNKYTINENGEKIGLSNTEPKISKAKSEWNLLDEIEYDSIDLSPVKSSLTADAKLGEKSGTQSRQIMVKNEPLTPDETRRSMMDSSETPSLTSSLPERLLEPAAKKRCISPFPLSALLPPSEYYGDRALVPKSFPIDTNILTSNEKRHLLKSYVPDTLRWCYEPRFTATKTGKLSHSKKIQNIIEFFGHMHSDARGKIIEMNRNNALAKSIAFNRSVGMELEVMLKSIIVPVSSPMVVANNAANLELSSSKNTENANNCLMEDLLADDDGLSDFLDD